MESLGTMSGEAPEPDPEHPSGAECPTLEQLAGIQPGDGMQQQQNLSKALPEIPSWKRVCLFEWKSQNIRVGDVCVLFLGRQERSAETPQEKNGIETIGPEPGRFSVLPGSEREVGNVCTGL